MGGINSKLREVISDVIGSVKPVIEKNTKEGFKAADEVDENSTIVSTIIAGIYMSIFGGILGFCLLGFGSAKLSYCYNQSIGTSIEMTYIYTALSFVFFYVYYPYYSIMLNPLCYKKPSVSMVRR